MYRDEKGNYFPKWNYDEMDRVSDLIVNKKFDLTVNHRQKTAFIGYDCGGVPDSIEQLPWEYAQALVNNRVVIAHSGNMGTGERHYNVDRNL